MGAWWGMDLIDVGMDIFGPLRSLSRILDVNLEIPKAAICLENLVEMANDRIADKSKPIEMPFVSIATDMERMLCGWNGQMYYKK